MKGNMKMNTRQKGLGGIQLLAVAATFAAMTLVVKPEFEAPDALEDEAAGKVKISAALDFASESKRKIEQSLAAGNVLPRTAREAIVFRPTVTPRPDFVTDVKFQHDYAGESFMVMVYLDNGVVENILGGEQYVYIAGIKTDPLDDTIEWQCGARNVNRTLLPEGC